MTTGASGHAQHYRGLFFCAREGTGDSSTPTAPSVPAPTYTGIRPAARPHLSSPEFRRGPARRTDAGFPAHRRSAMSGLTVTLPR